MDQKKTTLHCGLMQIPWCKHIMSHKEGQDKARQFQNDQLPNQVLSDVLTCNYHLTVFPCSCSLALLWQVLKSVLQQVIRTVFDFATCFPFFLCPAHEARAKPQKKR